MTPREHPDPLESKPQAAQLGWAGGQMDCAVAGRRGPAGPRVAMGTGVGCPALVGGGAGGWTVCGLGEGSEGACGVVASSPAAPPPAVGSLGPGAVARACNDLWFSGQLFPFTTFSILSFPSCDSKSWTKWFFGHSWHTCTQPPSPFVFETGSQPWLAWNSPCSRGWPRTQIFCLCLPSAGINGVCHTYIEGILN